jgi:signal transduction histidine kinase/CheY-like chemotaxis protein
MRSQFRGLGVIVLFWLSLVTGCQDKQSPSLPLTSVDQIQRLGESHLRQGLPVQLEGIVTFYDDTWRLMVVQDPSGGIPVEVRSHFPGIVRGDRIQLAGFTAYEGNFPIIVKPRLTWLSQESLPVAVPAELKRLFRGEFDYRLVEVECEVIRQWSAGLSHFGMEVQTGKFLFRVFGGLYVSAPLDSLLHKRIRLRGVPVSSYTPEGGIHSVRIFTGADDDIHITSPTGDTPVNSFELPSPAPGVPLNLFEATSIQNIKRIPNADAQKGYPLHIQAVVTNWDPSRFNFFVQDNTAGIYVYIPDVRDPRLGFGQRVEITGKSGRGSFAPVIRPEVVKVLGKGKMPAAVPVIPGEGFTGKEENIWAELEGIIRSGELDPVGGSQFQLSCGEKGIKVILQVNPPHFSPADLEDCLVRIQGVYAPIFTVDEMLAGFRLLTPSIEHIQVLKDLGGDDFLDPPRPIRSLQGFHPKGFPRHRVRLGGQLTFKGTDGSFYLADQTAGIRVLPLPGEQHEVGDRVQVLGYLSHTFPQLILESAQIRKSLEKVNIELAEIDAENAFSGLYNGKLVQVEGFLRERHMAFGDRQFLLTSGRQTFSALLEHPQSFPLWEDLRPGAHLRLTGVCQVIWNEGELPPLPTSFRLLLRTPADISIIHAAPWWTITRALSAMALLIGVLAVAVTWLTVLKRRLGSQQELLRKQMEQREVLETRLFQSQKLESIGRLAGGVAHDFNNLLTVINGYSEMLEVELEGQPGPSISVAEIKKAGEKASLLTRQLLAFSRKQVMQPVVLDLNDLVRELDKMLNRLIGEDIERVNHLSQEPCRVKVDPGQMSQVLINLAVNARDAMPDGGKLIIETQSVYLDEKSGKTQVEIPSGEYIQLSVGDTGVGMDEETRRHLFEPFFTTKGVGRGTGLGLATVFGIVKQSVGYIWVYSEPGQGTIFKIYLPKILESETPLLPEPAGKALSGHETLLVVEDQPEVRQLIVKGLVAQGYQILETSNAEEAIRCAQWHSGQIHLLLTDVVMPGLSGKELAQRLLEMRPGLRVLFMSGYTANVIAHKGILDAGVDYLQKPFSPKVLAIRVREVLEKN